MHNDPSGPRVTLTDGSDMPTRLRLGVIGLGRRWPRYRAALAGLRRQFEVRGLCDPVARRAEVEARRLDCAAAAGPVDLLERDDVDAVLLPGGPWYGLWPLGQACRLSKPVFCAASLAADEAHADDLHHRVREARLPVLMALAPALAQAAEHLRQLLAGPLGPARVVQVERVLSRRNPTDPAEAADLLRPGTVLALLHACAGLLGAEPVRVWTTGAPGLACILLEFAAGQAAQVTLRSGARSAGRVQVTAEGGVASAGRPGKLRWRDGDVWHARSQPRREPARELLEQFAGALRSGQAPRPDFADAYRALTWWRAARRSLAEGRRIDLAAPHV
jgi:predicted dehydrogenase